MEARNRTLKEWYGKLSRGEIKLPRFQRHEAWDRQRIKSLLETVIQDLPLGITLTLEVGDDEKFISRYLETAEPKTKPRVLEHLLDGQQRLTALWRSFHNNYESETYFVYFEEFDEPDKGKDQDDLSVICKARNVRKSGERYPLWCDSPSDCLSRGLVPTDLLKPEDIQGKIDSWLDTALEPIKGQGNPEAYEAYYEKKAKVHDRIKDLRALIANYNLPFLSLPPKTEKSVALDVFIKMNTNSKPLSQFDVIVAEVESVMGSSLHDLQESLDQRHPDVKRFDDLEGLILTTSALLQNALPNQRGAWDMNKETMVSNWELMEKGLSRMAKFLVSEGIYDRQRLPTNAVLAVIAALYSSIPESGDKLGQDEQLLKRYLWYSFFSDRYENSAATHAFADYTVMNHIQSGKTKQDGTPYTIDDVPIFATVDLPDKEDLLASSWPKRSTIEGRAVLAVVCRLGALDFSTGERIDANNIRDRHYHHIYPHALLKEAGVDGNLALNCALINDRTNMSIGRKDPLEYLKDRYDWTSEQIVQERLESHLIPIPELANGGYEGLSENEKTEKMIRDFELFIERRAELVSKALRFLVDGRRLNAAELFAD